MNLRDFTSPDKRREALSEELSISLSSIGASTLSVSPASEKNCENMIGFAQIPLGVGGPLTLKSEKGEENKRYFIPLATTEGALVASISRGCKAISESGGALASIENIGVTRGPVFKTKNLEEKKKLTDWIKENKDVIKDVAEETSGHLTFKDVQIQGLSNYTFLRFSFDTKDAMGMNMATIATEAVVSVIEKETGIQCVSVAGNFDIDKKPSAINFLKGRGVRAWAEVVIPSDIVQSTLKTTPKRFFDTWLAKCMLGSAMAGSLGYNSHFANVITAIFLATGQDIAHVVEGSLGVTTAEVLENGDLYVGVYIPSLMLGTVGGGTGLPTQKEALEMLGVKGDGKKQQFAKIVSATVLAGEISLLASLSEGTLGKAHKTLGRGK